MNIFIMSVLCFSFCLILLGFMVYLKRQDNLGKAWLIYSLFCGFWAMGYTFQINNQVDYQKALYASRFADAMALWVPLAWLHLVYEFLDRKMGRKLLVAIGGITFAIFLTTPTELFISGMKNKSHIGFDHFVVAGPSFHIFTALFVSVVFYGFILLLQDYLNSNVSAAKRRQILYFLFATAIGFLGASPAFLPVYDIDLPINYSTLLMPFFPFAMVFAITRYRLMDIDQMAHAAHREKLVAIGTLATSINHEIRNPLYVIQGLAGSFLANREEGIYRDNEVTVEKASEILTKVAEHSTRAMEIMKGFARFAKQTSNEIIETKIVKLDEILDGIQPLLARELEMSNIELVKSIPINFPSIQADPRQIEEILFNLVVNACQAIKAGSAAHGKILIHGSQNNGCIRLAIEDNGPGIAERQLSQIFEPFYTTKEEGTGLGLYITKQLVERNGGKIKVNSKLGQGTTFSLEFTPK